MARDLAVPYVAVLITVLLGVVGFSLGAVPVKGVHISPYRLALVATIVLVIFDVYMRGRIGGYKYINWNALWISFTGSVIFVLWGGSSVLWAEAKGAALIELGFLVQGWLIVFLIASYVSSRKRREGVERVWMGVFVVVVAVACFEIATGFHLPSSTYLVNEHSRVIYTPTGTFHNPNDLATFVVLSIPFFLTRLRVGRSLVKGVAIFVSIIFGVFVILETGSRSSLLALSIVFLLWMYFSFGLAAKIVMAGILLLGVLTLAMGVWGAVDKVGGNVWGQMATIFVPSEFVEYQSNQVRLNLLRNAYLMFVDSGGVGIGPGNFRYMNEREGVFETYGASSLHNWWVQVLVEYGVVVFCVYMMLIVYVLRKILRYRHFAGGKERTSMEAVFMGLASFFVAGIGGSHVTSFVPYWVVLGMAFSLVFHVPVCGSGRVSPDQNRGECSVTKV